MTNSLLQQFIVETRDLIESASSHFLVLEKKPDDKEILNNIFRAVHTIKGSSGLFDLKPLTGVVHAAEDLLDALRADQLILSTQIVDMILDSFELVNSWLDKIESEEKLPEGAVHLAEKVIVQLRAQLEDITPTDAQLAFANYLTIQQSDMYLFTIPQLSHLSETQSIDYFQKIEAGASCYLLIYQPDEGCFFTGDDPLYLLSQLPEIVDLEMTPREAWGELDEYDPFRCNLTFKVVTLAARSDIEEIFQYVPQQIQVIPIAPEAFIIPQGEMNGGPVYEDFVEEAIRLIEEDDKPALQRSINTLLELSSQTLWLSSVLRWAKLLLNSPVYEKASLLCLVHSLRTMTPPLWEGIERIVIENQKTEKSIELETDSQQETALPSKTKSNSLAGTIFENLSTEPQEGTTPWYGAFTSILREQLHILLMPCAAELIPGRLRAVAYSTQNCLTAIQQQALTILIDEALAKSLQENAVQPLLEVIQNILKEFVIETDKEQEQNYHKELPAESHISVQDKTPPLPSPSTKPVAHKTPVSHPKEEHPTTGSSSRNNALNLDEGFSPETSARGLPKILKIDQAKIDKLMDLIGELVVAKNSLPYLARRAEQHYGSRDLSREIKDQYGVINRITQEMQGSIMQVRMLPVSHVFQRFPNLVRSISRKLNKQINLIIEGESTEADKNVIEQLFDPLLHIVRNSMDHGIETVDERLAIGKNQEGTLRLSAFQDNDNVVIEISDDGRGIDPEVIKRKAYEKGLIDEARLDNISDDEAIQLVFAPGFSTAEQITDISGRGVGMDVVRTVVQKANGSVHLSSEKGQGTICRLALPLSMAITRVMTIEVAGRIFGVPMDVILETVHIQDEDIHMIKDKEAFVLRNRIVPLIRLTRILCLTPLDVPATTSSHPVKDNDELHEESVLVVRIGGEDIGVIVDEFHEGVEIILKPLDGILATLTGYAGTALLGDGRVLLVLNLKELI